MKTYFRIITWYSRDVDTLKFSPENLLGLSEALLRLLQLCPLGGERNVSDVVIGSRNVPDSLGRGGSDICLIYHYIHAFTDNDY
jgi:hypothetical protein